LKYLKQCKTDNCGLYALLNAARFFGIEKVNLRKLGYKKGIGVHPKTFEKFLKTSKNLPFKLSEIIPIPTISEIKNSLSNQECVILGVDYKGYAHVGVVVKITNNYVTLANWWNDKPTRRVHVNTLKKWTSGWSIAYCLEKL
jgi:hypothetical protein